jgi:hypothetical protein
MTTQKILNIGMKFTTYWLAVSLFAESWASNFYPGWIFVLLIISSLITVITRRWPSSTQSKVRYPELFFIIGWLLVSLAQLINRIFLTGLWPPQLDEKILVLAPAGIVGMLILTLLTASLNRLFQNLNRLFQKMK